MPSAKDKKSKKLLKIDVSSGSDSDASEHELSHYAKDKVKLMKEVLKLIKPKKIKSMAPDCIKDLDIVEINSMLLEELLGISNKRLQYIFNGENVDRETSSSESEEEKQPIDVISLDDISDDDDIELCISQDEKDSLEPSLLKKNKHKSHKIKTEAVETSVKLEKLDKSRKDKKKSRKTNETKKRDDLKETDKDKLMSVLELLELQARARAIRSQLAIETEKKKENELPENSNVKQEDTDSDAIIIDSPQHKEIVITSSDSENESCSKRSQAEQSSSASKSSKHIQKIDSNSASPQKKQKLHTQEQDVSNKTEQENKLTNVAEELVIDNEMQKNKESTEIDNKKRKEKLFAKIQKIKLIRNRAAISSQLANTEISKINEKNQSEDNSCSNESAVGAVTKISEQPSTSKEVHNADVLTNNKDSEVQLKNDENSHELTNDLAKESENTDINKDVRNNDSSNKFKSLPAGDGKKTNVNDCDNDEIVINLDEDEMDGIEN